LPVIVFCWAVAANDSNTLAAIVRNVRISLIFSGC